RGARVGRTRRRRPGAEVGRVALARRSTAEGRRRLELVDRAERARAVAALGHVADAGRRPAERARVARRVRARVARAVASIERAGVSVLGAVGAERLLRVHRTDGGAAVAGLAEVTLARGRTAGRARVARRVRACIGVAVALIERAGVAVVRARRARRALDV